MALLLAYVVLLSVAVIRRDGGQVMTALLLLINWAMNAAFAHVMDEPFPWTWYLVVDYMTALFLYIGRENRWQTALILTYAVELLMHAAFGYSDCGRWAQWHYWWGMYYVAWGQVALVGAWIGHEVARNWLSHRRRISSDLDSHESAGEVSRAIKGSGR